MALAPLPRAEVEPALDKGFAALAWRASPGPVAGVPSGGAAEQSPERPVETSTTATLFHIVEHHWVEKNYEVTFSQILILFCDESDGKIRVQVER